MDGSIESLRKKVRSALEDVGVPDERIDFVISRFGLPVSKCRERGWIRRVNRALNLGDKITELQDRLAVN